MLQESKAGLAVGKLRSNSSKQVSDLAKEIVKKWKNEVEREKQAAGGGKASKPPGAHARPCPPHFLSSYSSTCARKLPKRRRRLRL